MRKGGRRRGRARAGRRAQPPLETPDQRATSSSINAAGGGAVGLGHVERGRLRPLCTAFSISANGYRARRSTPQTRPDAVCRRRAGRTTAAPRRALEGGGPSPRAPTLDRPRAEAAFELASVHPFPEDVDGRVEEAKFDAAQSSRALSRSGLASDLVQRPTDYTTRSRPDRGGLGRGATAALRATSGLWSHRSDAERDHPLVRAEADTVERGRQRGLPAPGRPADRISRPLLDRLDEVVGCRRGRGPCRLYGLHPRQGTVDHRLAGEPGEHDHRRRRIPLLQLTRTSRPSMRGMARSRKSRSVGCVDEVEGSWPSAARRHGEAGRQRAACAAACGCRRRRRRSPCGSTGHPTLCTSRPRLGRAAGLEESTSAVHQLGPISGHLQRAGVRWRRLCSASPRWARISRDEALDDGSFSWMASALAEQRDPWQLAAESSAVGARSPRASTRPVRPRRRRG